MFFARKTGQTINTRFVDVRYIMELYALISICTVVLTLTKVADGFLQRRNIRIATIIYFFICIAALNIFEISILNEILISPAAFAIPLAFVRLPKTHRYKRIFILLCVTLIYAGIIRIAPPLELIIAIAIGIALALSDQSETGSMLCACTMPILGRTANFTLMIITEGYGILSLAGADLLNAQMTCMLAVTATLLLKDTLKHKRSLGRLAHR